MSPASGRSSPTGPHADQDSESWLSSLQQAARLEADRGFGDLMGRHESFASFVARCLAAPPSSLSADSHSVFAPLAESFRQYPEASLSRRQQLVRQLRQGLHQARVLSRPELPVAPPRLRLAEASDPPGMAGVRVSPSRAAGSAPPAASPYAAVTVLPARMQQGIPLQPSTPLAEVSGIGPRTATRLAGLGLLLAGDLIRHYPRDYLDYANLVRITALEPGRTATVVATVRRCHAFASPRNPNLSILELHLQIGRAHV